MTVFLSKRTFPHTRENYKIGTTRNILFMSSRNINFEEGHFGGIRCFPPVKVGQEDVARRHGRRTRPDDGTRVTKGRVVNDTCLL